jgi:hypothetical protein
MTVDLRDLVKRSVIVRLLCLHQSEGARVGTPEFTFTDADDVIRARDGPTSSAAFGGGLGVIQPRRSW